MKLSSITKTFDDLPLTIKLVTEGQTKDAEEFVSMIIAAENVVRATFRWLFTQETVPTHVKSIILAVKEELHDPKMKFHSELVDGVIHIDFSNEFIDTIKTKYGDEFIIPGIIFHRVSFHFLERHFQDDSYPHQICTGFCDYVRVKAGIIPSSPDGQTTDSEFVWYGRDVLPYFLDWLGRTYGEDSISKLVLEFQAPYDSNVSEKVTKTPISTLWTMYCAFISKEKRGDEWPQNSES